MLHSFLPRSGKAGPSRARRWLAAAAVAVPAVIGASSLAAADTTPAPPPADASAPPSAVEDFGYPGAGGITKVKLLRGDGHVLLTDCAQPSEIQIWTRAPGNPDNKVCFTAAGTVGTLTLELPDVFAVQTSGRAVRVGLTVGGAAQTLDVPKDGFQGVGEGTGQAPSTLVDLRITG
ncbi:hypothetical protein ACFVHB_32510 [Kitasatospora sp. NPDC127111]|uniref:hypothetical protein n=1 Tax=Kitasatospora sp. NPDC127111 TaxID=3345363 RepID=UPI003632D0BB